MKVIYKYKLELVTEQTVRIPLGAVILSVGIQKVADLYEENNEEIFVWALVDKQEITEDRAFLIVGTGGELDIKLSSWKFIGTVQMPPYAWHIFY